MKNSSKSAHCIFFFCGWNCSVVISMWVNILIIVQHLIPPLLQSAVIIMWVSLQGVRVYICGSMYVPAYQALFVKIWAMTFHENTSLETTK